MSIDISYLDYLLSNTMVVGHNLSTGSLTPGSLCSAPAPRRNPANRTWRNRRVVRGGTVTGLPRFEETKAQTPAQ